MSRSHAREGEVKRREGRGGQKNGGGGSRREERKVKREEEMPWDERECGVVGGEEKEGI